MDSLQEQTRFVSFIRIIKGKMSRPEDPRSDPPVSTPAPILLVPVSAADYASGKRRIVFAWIAAGLLVSILAFWGYRRSVDPLDAQRALEEGRRLLKATRYAEAILTFDRAVALQSELSDAYMLRGRASMALSRLEPAIQDFTTVIRLRPNAAEAYVERAEARLAQQDYQAAIADCGEALARDPMLALAYRLRGTAVRQTGHPQQAVEDLTRAVNLAPDESSYFQRAATYQMLGQPTLAIADLDQVIALKPDDPQAYFARAQSRRALGDTAGANQDHRQALVLDGR
jgi:tetratricopeptide (TPR) repeat protein